MLLIRTEQIDKLKQAALVNFENEMLCHLSEFSPPLLKAIGEVQMRETIKLGIEKAYSYGFNFRGPVRLYLELMLLFGSHFDTDPQYAWAALILNDRESEPQMDRADRLYQKTMDYRRKVAGPDDVYTLTALNNIWVMAKGPLLVSTEQLAPSLLNTIRQIYPQKAEYVGTQALENLIHKAIGGAQHQQFDSVRGIALVSILMLAFGHGCGNDPLYPWIANTLKDETIPDAQAKATRLERKALIWLQHVMKNFGEDLSV